MPLSLIEITGYRGFREKGTLTFAEPNGKLGSGLTLITGPNNSGKSSILECLRARSGHQLPSFTAGTRNSSIDCVKIEYEINGSREIIRSINKGSSENSREIVDGDFQVFVLPSRRAFNPYFHRGEMTRDIYLRNTGLPAQRASQLSYFEQRLFSTLKKPDDFNNLLDRVLGFKPSWTIDQSDQGQYFLKFFNGAHSHSSDGMGEGIVSIFSIVDALYDSMSGGMVVIDEPELSLHPSLQKRLSSLLNEFAADRQIVIATHSPYFVEINSLRNGGQIARVITGSEGTKIYQLGSSARAGICRLADNNVNNPHIFGLDAREFFFQEDRIILTEGQEDVLLYPQVARELGVDISGNFFGWGAGGASNVKFLCAALKDLGFKKVAALLDGDKIAIKENLVKEFPEYHFANIPAADIRTKPPRKAVESVLGLLNGGKVRPEFASATREVLNALSRHMDS